MNFYGDFDVAVFDASPNPALAYVLYFVYALLFSVLMMNLLIAFLSDSFTIVQDRNKSALMQERADLCVELQSVFPKRWRQNIAERQAYLFVMVPENDVEDLTVPDRGGDQFRSIVTEQMADMQRQLELMSSRLPVASETTNAADLGERVDRMERKIDQLLQLMTNQSEAESPQLKSGNQGRILFHNTSQSNLVQAMQHEDGHGAVG